MSRAKGLLKPLPSRFFLVSKGMPGRSVVLQKAHLCRENFFISKSWEGSSRCLKLFWARLSVCRAERADWPFSIVAVWGPSKRAKPCAWDPPPGSLVWAYSARSLVLIVPKNSFLSRGSTTFEIFWRWVSLVETELGESRDSRLRMGWSTVFVGASYRGEDRKSTRLNSSHDQTSYAVFCLKKQNNI